MGTGMGAPSNSVEAIGHWVVQRRAARIEDPVAKLRYLRGAIDSDSGRVVRAGAKRCLHRAKVLALAGLFLLPASTISDTSRKPVLPTPTLATGPGAALSARIPNVWLVEEARSYELYSNGLRIDTRYTVGNGRRPYPVYRKDTLALEGWQTGPVGILFHTTESNIAPFEAKQNKRLRRVGRWLLEYVQKKRAYHFIIDRFGRVHRVVRETDTANHAGYSVWADAKHVYVNLNPSFIGVSFEAQSDRRANKPPITPAQAHAAKVLTEMLRSRYGIAAENCVTHAQVSVYSRSMRVGNHVDWAANFPFEALGLGENYSRPNAAVAVFGFKYGPTFLKVTGGALWKGLAFGEDEFRQLAATRGVSVARYRAAREKRYQEIIADIEEKISSQEHGS